MALCAAAFFGCSTPQGISGVSVSQAWRKQGHGALDPASAGPTRDQIIPDRALPQQQAHRVPILATVNGHSITRGRVVDLLLESRGAAVMEQLINLYLAQDAAHRKGLEITTEDVEAERDRTLRRLTDPFAAVAFGAFDRETAKRVLDAVLLERSMSREMLDILIRRNAYLRKIATADEVVTEAQLHDEFERVYGRRVQVRHIQLATAAEVGRVRERLERGESFGALAQRYSANATSAMKQGLMTPFSESDTRVPALFRKVAFALRAGEVSDAIRTGEWYHLLKVEKFLPREARKFERVRGELETILRDRRAEPKMWELLEELHRDASIDILDPRLSRELRSRSRGGSRLSIESGKEGIEGEHGD